MKLLIQSNVMFHVLCYNWLSEAGFHFAFFLQRCPKDEDKLWSSLQQTFNLFLLYNILQFSFHMFWQLFVAFELIQHHSGWVVSIERLVM